MELIYLQTMTLKAEKNRRGVSTISALLLSLLRSSPGDQNMVYAKNASTETTSSVDKQSAESSQPPMPQQFDNIKTEIIVSLPLFLGDRRQALSWRNYATERQVLYGSGLFSLPRTRLKPTCY